MSNTKDNKFNFFVPVEMEKARKGDKDKYKNMYVWGVGSDDSIDSDEEVLDPKGYDLGYFLNSALINYEHMSKKDPSTIIGEPLEAKVEDNKLFVKGRLYEKVDTARKLWDAMGQLEESGATRKVGWSIEGKAVRRDPNNPKKILKARLTGIALTWTPKNKNTWAQIVKGEYAEPYVEPEYDETANGGSEFLLDVTRPDGTQITIDKEFNVKIGKAMSVGHQTGRELTGKNTSGAALKRESLKEELINLQPDFIKSVIIKLAEKSKSKSKEWNNRAKNFIKKLV